MADFASIRERLVADIGRLRRGDLLYAGFPWFQGVYGRDSLIAGWQLLKHDAAIASATLRLLAEKQGKRVNWRTEEEPGKILHVCDFRPHTVWHGVVKGLQRVVQGFPYYGSIDATPLFVIVAGAYFQATGDGALMAEIWPNIERAVDWLGSYGDADGDGLVEYRRRNPFSLRNQNWKDGVGYLAIKRPVAAVEVQGYVYAAYQAGASLARALGKPPHDWVERAARLKDAFNERFWMDDLGFFAMALDGQKRPIREIASNAGHLLFTGILDRERADKVVARLFQRDMITEYGLRSHSSLSRYFRRNHLLGPIWPHDNWLVWVGLKALGYSEPADMIVSGLLRAFGELKCLPEFYDVENGQVIEVPRTWRGVRIGRACCPQAWSSGALLNMLEDPGLLGADVSRGGHA